MIDIVKKNWSLYLLLTAYFVLGGFLLFVIDKGDIVIYLNRLHNPVFDYFFKIWSFVGNGIFSGIIILLVYPINKKKFVVLAVNSLIVGLLAQLFKRLVFPDMLRPLKILGADGFHFVDGVKVVSYHSFPSGHTASAFGLLVMLSLMFDNKRASFLFFVAAVLVAVSRMYLFQHFYMDTYAGALLATIVSTIVFYIFKYHTKLGDRL